MIEGNDVGEERFFGISAAVSIVSVISLVIVAVLVLFYFRNI